MATATIEIGQPRALPRPIRRGLRRLGLRLRAVGAMRGLGQSMVILAILAALAMASDVAFVLSQGARWTILAAWIATAVVALAAGVIRPWIRRLAWNDLAALAERGEPSLGERLTTAVGLLRQRPHGSSELIAAVVDDATARAGQVKLTRAVSVRKPFSWLVAGGLASSLVVAPAIVKPDPFAMLVKRFFSPWADIDRVGRFVVDVVPGDKVVALGSDVAISATIRSRFGEALPRDDAWLEWTDARGTPNRVKMVAAAGATQDEPTFSLTLPRLTGSLSYRAFVGGNTSRRHHITAVERPAIVSLHARVLPPAYTRRAETPARDPARIEAWEDSRVKLEVEANRPLKHAEVTWPGLEAQGKSSSAGGASQIVPFQPGAGPNQWSATVIAEASGPFMLKLRDRYDLESPPDAARRVVVRPDLPPSLAIAAPDDFKETAPTDLLTVAIVARDDVAVASVELHYVIDRSMGSTGAKSGSVAAPLTGLTTPVAQGEALLSFAPLGLKPGDTITYRVRAADNRPAPRGPNITWSQSRLIRIIEHSASLRARQETAEREALRARLEAIQKAAATNRDKAHQLRYQADEVLRGHGAWDETKSKDLAAQEKLAHEVSDQLQLLSRDLEEHPTFQPLARPARQIAQLESQAARATLETARRASDPAGRQSNLEQSATRLGAVASKVDELKRKFDELARVDDDRRRMGELAQREDALATRADQAAAAADRGKVEALADEQKQLERDLEEVLKNSPTLRAEALSAAAAQAGSLAARARALAEAERDEARRTADVGARHAAIKALAARQRALEDDARRLATRIDEPLGQNSRARVDVDALARAGEAIERGDLDQARDRATESENALNRLTRDVEDLRSDPKALARRLARRQEELRNQTVEAVRESREHPPQTPEGKAALAERLKPLFERQQAIARLAAAIPVAAEQQGAARDATRATALAREDLKEPRPKDVEGHQNEARDSLNRLADSLPDPNQLRERARQKLGEAKARHEEIARDLEKHLRETAPQPGQAQDPVRAAVDLADRVMPLVRREREVAEALRAIEPEPRAIPQRDRAARRANELADALETLRQQAPSAPAVQAKPDEPRPLVAWRVVGAFAMDKPAPFATDKPIDLALKHADHKGQPALWRPSAPVDAQGTIDLGQLYGREDKLAAFGYTETTSPTPRSARMLIGSDDTLTVWCNGTKVYDFQGDRSYGPATDRIDVSLVEGINRIVVKSGNRNGDWKYSLALSPPPEGYRPITDWRSLGPFASGNNPPFPTDGPIDLGKKHENMKKQPTMWQSVKPANDRGAIDLAKHYSLRDKGTAAFGYSEVKSDTARQARLLVGSNDTFTLWFNGKQVYDSQVSRSWAYDQARIDVPLAGGTNRILVKCGNTGGNWMYSVAVSEDSERLQPNQVAELGHRGPSFERLREALPAVQVATRAALDRLQQKLDGQTPADDLAAALAADEHDAQSAEARTPVGDAAALADLATDQRRIANALSNLEAPDAPLARAEAIDRAREAAAAIEAKDHDNNPAPAREAIARATMAASALASQLGDDRSPRERIRQLANLQHALAEPHAAGDAAGQAKEEHDIGTELVRIPVENKNEAAEAIAVATTLSDQTARLEPGPRPNAAALKSARDRAAVALDKLAARATDQVPHAAGHDVPLSNLARAPEDPALGLTPVEQTEAAALAQRQRHIRERLQAILGEAAREQQALAARSTALAHEVAELRDRAREISPRAEGPANAAANLLGRAAPEAMDRAAVSLQQGRPAEALWAQRQSADQAEQGARQVEDLAAALRADRPTGVADPPDGVLTQAQAAMLAAGEHLSQARAAAHSPSEAADATRTAAAAMHTAAQRLHATDRAARGTRTALGPTNTTNQPSGPLTDKGAPDLAGLKAALRAGTGRAWGELPGHLKTEILQMSEGRYRDDYARLIELYFREIAAEASARGTQP